MPEPSTPKPNYRCPVCGVRAYIDVEGRNRVIHVPTPTREELERRVPRLVIHFPVHADCPLALPIDKIDFSKLERLK